MFFQASKIILLLTLQSAWKASSLPFPNQQEILESTIGDDGRSRSVTNLEISCLVKKVHVLYEDHGEDHWNCIVKDRAILRALGTKSNTFQLLGEEVNDFLEKGEESEDTFGGIWSLTISPGVELVPETQDLKVEMSHIISFNDAKPMFLDKKASSVDRAVDSGDLKALVVRVTTNDASPPSAIKLANDIFQDALNLRNQYAACSYNKVNIYPSTSALPGNLKYSAMGVIDIRINVNANGNSNRVLETAARTRVADLFGLDDHDDMEDLFDLVLYAQPPGTGNWVAYAYFRSFDSYYNDYWSGSVSALIHEVGHNMNLGHSGLPTGSDSQQEYGDKSGMMGYSYNEDDAPRQCFNSVKSWQLGWYDDKRLELNARAELRSGPKRYVLNGVADYRNGSAGNYIIIKIGYFYIGYNRATGINSGTQAAQNAVTIHQKLGGPYSNQNSKRLAILAENYYTRIPSANLRISFLGTTNGLRDAIVEISLLEEDNNPCDGDLEVVLKTDLYPAFTVWGVYDPVAQEYIYVGDNYAKKQKIYTEKIDGLCREKTYRFVIVSRQNIGLCCKYGEGYFQGKHDGKVLFQGAEFTDRMDIDFMIPSRSPGPSPTPVPTPSPTPAPTRSPTNPPQPTPDSGACDGDPERQFQLELRTDSYGSETSWAIFKIEGQDIVEDPVYYGLDYESNTLYTLPSEDEFYCLELERCYRFVIFDSYGDGMDFGENTGYKGFLGGDEIFSGDGTFGNDGEYEAHRFCVGDGVTLPPTGYPSSTSTYLGTDPFPTASPTSSPTPAPTPSPTPAPTPSPTPAPSSFSTTLTTGCSDNPDFRFKDKKNKTCKKYLKGKKKKKLRKKCKKKWRGKKVMDWCAETCGKKVGMGRCGFLQSE